MNLKTLYKIIRLIVKTNKQLKVMNNLKDILSTICGVIIAICGAGTGLIWQLGITLPHWISVVAIALAGVAVIVLGLLQGKNPNGSTKTPTQVNELNTQAKDTKEIKH